jgi:hypothetical protein
MTAAALRPHCVIASETKQSGNCNDIWEIQVFHVILRNLTIISLK